MNPIVIVIYSIGLVFIGYNIGYVFGYKKGMNYVLNKLENEKTPN